MNGIRAQPSGAIFYLINRSLNHDIIRVEQVGVPVSFTASQIALPLTVRWIETAVHSNLDVAGILIELRDWGCAACE